MKGTIINITRCCTDDGPGIRTTVFLKGCPLHCLWCHNPESQDPAVEVMRGKNGEETVGRVITAEEAAEEVLRDRAFYKTSGGGVTVSGGEPLFQPDFTAELLRICRENGVHTAVETSGFSARSALDRVLDHCDLLLFDIKETEEARHRACTGVPLRPIWDNLRHADARGVPTLLRLPIVPGFNDRQEHFAAVRALAQSLAHCRGTQIMPYHVLGVYKYGQLGREYACRAVREPDRDTVAGWNRLLAGE